MEKKEMLLHVIREFEEHGYHAPRELLDELKSIRTSLETMSNAEIEKLDGPSTSPAGKKEYDPTNPVMRLSYAFSDMEKYTYTGEKDENLYDVMQQMRGIFDIPDRYYP